MTDQRLKRSINLVEEAAAALTATAWDGNAQVPRRRVEDAAYQLGILWELLMTEEREREARTLPAPPPPRRPEPLL